MDALQTTERARRAAVSSQRRHDAIELRGFGMAHPPTTVFLPPAAGVNGLNWDEKALERGSGNNCEFCFLDWT